MFGMNYIAYVLEALLNFKEHVKDYCQEVSTFVMEEHPN